MAEFASKGVAGAGLGLGIAGTALGLMNGNLGRIFGGIATPQTVVQPSTVSSGVETAAISALTSMLVNTPRNNWGGGCCSEDHLINRYEASQQARIAELETEVKLRDANTYTDQKILATYQYIDSQLKNVRDELCAQAVVNQHTQDSFALARADIAAVKTELDGKINMEAERRCCADRSIVNYVNATFYPKMVADVTVGTTTTAQTLFNPIPGCGDCCNRS
ncbi:MAG: hypothetical protein ACI4MP_06880 [Candidatus Ventricola sp.]